MEYSMKANLTRNLCTFTFGCMALLTISIPTALAGETEEFVDKLKTHYQKTLPIKTFSLSYRFLNKQYRDNDYWDYQTPNRISSQRTVEIDLVK